MTAIQHKKYNTRIQMAVEFIEDNLKESFSLDEVAAHASFSIFHFHRLFAAKTGFSIMEYVRRRRLSEAAFDLIKSRRKIIDIAFDYQYEAPESFTRAFRKQYKMNPGIFRRKYQEVTCFEKLNLSAENGYSANTNNPTCFHTMIINKEPKIVRRKETLIIGAEIRTTTENDKNIKEIPKFWQEQMAANLFDHIPNRKSPNECLGVCANMDEKGFFSYYIACEVTTLDNIPEGLSGLTIPAAKYAVFTAKGPIPQSIHDMWQYAYGEWLPKSPYEFANSIDFELYDERFHKEDGAETDIYIPVK